MKRWARLEKPEGTAAAQLARARWAAVGDGTPCLRAAANTRRAGPAWSWLASN